MSLGVLLDGKPHNAAQAVGLVVAALACAFVMLFGWYWVLTPVPVLRIDAAGMSYQGFPFVVTWVRWEDVRQIRATKTRAFRRGRYGQRPVLTVFIDLVPQTDARYARDGSRRSLVWLFSNADLPGAPEVIVRQIEDYHAVVYTDRYNQVKQGGLLGAEGQEHR